jgi:hypothetical protein
VAPSVTAAMSAAVMRSIAASSVTRSPVLVTT